MYVMTTCIDYYLIGLPSYTKGNQIILNVLKNDGLSHVTYDECINTNIYENTYMYINT